MIRRAFGTALFVVLFCSPLARAETTDAAAARELFRRGQDDMKSERTDAACAKFAEAQRLDPNVGYLVNLARCDEKRGHLVDARESWLKALDLAKRRSDPRQPDVQAGVDAIDRTVPRLQIRLAEGAAAPRDLRVRRDDVVLGPASLGVPLPLDPGRHVIVAEAPGHEPWTKEIVVAPNAGPVSIEIGALVAKRAEPATPAPAPAAADEGSETRGSAQRVLGAIAGGLGVVMAAGGAFFSLRAMSLDDESNRGCDAANACTLPALGQRDDALAAADLATGAFIAAGVLAATGIVLYLTAPSSSKPHRSATAVGVWRW